VAKLVVIELPDAMQNNAKAYIRTSYEKSSSPRVTIWQRIACIILLSGVFPLSEKQHIEAHIALTVSQTTPFLHNPLLLYVVFC
jgi:hypothetical protein